MKKLALLLFLVPLCAGAAGAFDFGFLLDQTAGVGGIGGDTEGDYSVSLIPWFSMPIGDSGDIFVSAGLTAGYEYKKGFFVAELLRTEFSWRFNKALRLRAGRLSYADPLNFVVDGLFDGAQVSYNTAIGTFNAGVMYSGLLYKKTTPITMTEEDRASYYLDYNIKYRSSDRMLMAVGWEHPALKGLVNLGASFTAQLDLNGRANPYHSQYLTVKAGIPFRQFAFEMGGALQMAQDARKFGIAFAGEIGASWDLPLAFRSRLLFNGRFSSGRTESGSIAAFVPVTTLEHGGVLKAKLSGLSVLNLDYTARILRNLSAGAAMTYFIRSDLPTYADYPVVTDSEGHLLGAEFFGRVIWGPFSDLRLNVGGGIFLPALGNVAPKEKPLWRLEINLILMLY